MTDYLSAVVLGIVEGVTEFLPVSSTGHLILFNRWFAFDPEFTHLFDIVIQSGAILAVIVIFWSALWPEGWTVKGMERAWGRLLAAFVPTAVLGVLFGDVIEEHLFSPVVVAAMLVAYGIAFLVVEKTVKRGVREEVGYGDALLIGCIQSLAMVPGTSRSGATILGMLLLGYARTAAARFSFLLAVPTLLAASAYSFMSYEGGLSGRETVLLALGFVAAFVSAYAVSRWFLGYVSKRDFVPFAWYRIGLGVLVLSGMLLWA